MGRVAKKTDGYKLWDVNRVFSRVSLPLQLLGSLTATAECTTNAYQDTHLNLVLQLTGAKKKRRLHALIIMRVYLEGVLVNPSLWHANRDLNKTLGR